MKKLIAICAIVSVATAFAEDNVFGCLRVDSSATETIVSVPWIGVGVNGEAINVADIVKTANLTPADSTPSDNMYTGDELWWYDPDNGVYRTWRLNSSRVWVPADTETGSAAQKLARGNALLIIRKDPSKPFYLYGQVPTSPVAEMTLGVGTDTAPCYTLIAPPSVTDTNINSAIWKNVAANDYILVVDNSGKQHQLFYSGSEWGELSYDDNFDPVYDDTNAKIIAGQGAWFVSAKAKKDTVKTAASVKW